VRIALDADGCQFDWDAGVIRAYKTWFGIDTAPAKTWDDPVDRTHFETIGELFEWLAQVPDFWYELDPIPGAIGAVHALSARHDVVIATSRPASAHDQTRKCFEHWGLGHLPIVFGSDKTAADALVYVDDSPDVLAALVKGGHPAIRYRQPWNTAKKVPGTPADNWSDVMRLIADFEDVLA
jgi:5'(3')-deoxyribonucleotidase